MPFTINTVGEITLPTGETVQGVILTSDDPIDIRNAARHCAGKVDLLPIPEAINAADVEPELLAALINPSSD